jgi:hypothetical protein
MVTIVIYVLSQKQRNELGTPTMRLESNNYSNLSPATNGPCTVHAEPAIDFKGQQNSTSLNVDHGGPVDLISEATQVGELKGRLSFLFDSSCSISYIGRYMH